MTKSVFIFLIAISFGFADPLQAASPLKASFAAPKTQYNLSLEELELEVSALLEQQGAADKVHANFMNHRDIAIWHHSTPLQFLFENMRYSNRNGQWNAMLHISSEGKSLRTLNVTGRFEPLIEVPVLSRRLGNNDVIEADDIIWVNVPESRLRKDTVLVEDELLGQSPRRSVPENRPISASELVAPRMVKKNAMVPITYRTEYMHIRAMGITLEDGAKGDIIRVRNADSNAVIRAAVTESGHLEIITPQQFAQVQ